MDPSSKRPIRQQKRKIVLTKHKLYDRIASVINISKGKHKVKVNKKLKSQASKIVLRVIQFAVGALILGGAVQGYAKFIAQAN